MLTRSLRWQSWSARPFHSRSRSYEPPLRAELFGIEQLARLARALAARHQTARRRNTTRLLPRLTQNEEILRDYNRATIIVERSRQVTPAAEWLLDNFYLIEEQIQLARRHLPRNYSHELPRLAQGPSEGLPRIYDAVLELISHVDAQVDVAPLTAFIAAYQTVSPLKLGELWAIPIMLRLGLIENLRRITARLTIDRADRDLADAWAQRLQDMAENDPSHLVVVVADMATSELPLSSAFVAEFCQRLSRQNPVLHLARGWLEERLAAQGSTIEQLIHIESQNQAADQVSVSHTIASLRFLGAMNWKDFVEAQSLVEQSLRSDPAGVYARMDFSTRDRYRHAIEALARQSGLAENEVARHALQLAADRARQHGADDRTAHVGYFLIDEGLPLLERAVRATRPWPTLVERSIHRSPLLFYAGGILALTALSSLWFWRQARPAVVEDWQLGALVIALVVAASQLALALMNWLALLVVKPRLLPRLDYSTGIDPTSRTMVVVPTLITNAEGVDRLLETLEIHHLANRDRHLHFALLTDFRDALTETEADDEPLLTRAQAGIERLNARHSTGQPGYFFLFHRPRRWNASERRWMGYERNRGKLAEFNGLLRGGFAHADCVSE